MSKNKCEQKCVNEIGGYRCECNDRFQLQNDGRACKSMFLSTMELCQDGKNCDKKERTRNITKSFENKSKIKILYTKSY